MAEAKTIQTQVSQETGGVTTFNAGALGTAFLDWSAWESSYGSNAALIAENNDFGAQDEPNLAGMWNGASVVCNRNGFPIAANSQNACFAPDLSWGDELVDVLGGSSGKTGVTYLAALLNGELATNVNGNESVAGILQSLASNGWNADKNYGKKLSGAYTPLVECLVSNGYVK